MYSGILVLVVVVATIAVKLAYAHGELDTVSLQAAPSATPVPSASLAAQPSLRWHTTDHPAGGSPYDEGIVVTYSGHTVNGRDALTGDVRWHYTRSDEIVCAVVQQDGSTIASYQRGANCDQVTGFTTTTGRPKWYRTLPDNGPLAVSSTSNVVLIVAAGTVHAFDNFSGLDRWTFTAPDGCSIDRALGGTLGVLIAYHCGQQNHLTLHELTSQSDGEKWTVDVDEPYVPVAAGAVLAAAGAVSGRAYVLDPNNGRPGRQLNLGSPATVAAAVGRFARSATTVEGSSNGKDSVEFATVGALFCLDSGGRVLWTAPATGAPSTTSSTVIASLPGRVVLYRTVDGSVERSVPIESSTTQGGDFSAATVGAGVLVTGADVAYYR